MLSILIITNHFIFISIIPIIIIIIIIIININVIKAFSDKSAQDQTCPIVN